MKLTITAAEAAGYLEARRLIDEVNATLKERGELITLAVTAVRDDVPGSVLTTLTLVTADAIPA